MENEISHHERLIVRYLTGEISPGEENELLGWLEGDEKHKDFFFENKSIWQKTGSIKILNDTEKEWKTLYRRMEKIRRPTSGGFWVRFVKTAAVFLFAFTIGWIVKTYFTETSEQSWLEINVPTGQITRVKLSDSTNVWMNSESTLRYPSDFSQDNRKVVLSGEAYFEVYEDRESPFTVETDYLNVQVSGTRFNVSAYEEDQELRTTLLDGRVTLNRKDSDKVKTILYPGDQARLDKIKGILTIQQFPDKANGEIGWVKGRYEFYDEPLYRILNVASRWYGLQFSVSTDTLTNTHFTGVMKKEYPIEQLLGLIKKTEDVLIKRNNNTIILKPQN
jgi:ferric-dicitrate binding protein FerR (iron transport regulator)